MKGGCCQSITASAVDAPAKLLDRLAPERLVRRPESAEGPHARLRRRLVLGRPWQELDLEDAKPRPRRRVSTASRVLSPRPPRCYRRARPSRPSARSRADGTGAVPP